MHRGPHSRTFPPQVVFFALNGLVGMLGHTQSLQLLLNRLQDGPAGLVRKRLPLRQTHRPLIQLHDRVTRRLLHRDALQRGPHVHDVHEHIGKLVPCARPQPPQSLDVGPLNRGLLKDARANARLQHLRR